MPPLSPALLPLLQAAGHSAASVVDYTHDAGANLCIINLQAIESNIAVVRSHLPATTRLMAMVKAHAYGSDGARLAHFFLRQGIDILGVAYASEAAALRRAGVEGSLFTINVAPHDAPLAAQYDLEAGVGSAASITALGHAAVQAGRRLKVHLHIDTGMRRLGCSPKIALTLAEQISTHPALILEGVMTHCAAADDPSHDAFTERQMELFDEAIAAIHSAGIPIPWLHAANSSAALRFHWPRYNMARLGLSLWGFSPYHSLPSLLPLRPALTLLSQIHEIHLCYRGDTVSYGCNYRIEEEQKLIAVLPIGYGDGLHRHYSGKGQVMIHGKLAPMVGNICMDYMMVDVTHIPQAAIGDPVFIFGHNAQGDLLPLEGLAHSGNSIAHELIACLGSRIPRVFVHTQSTIPSLNPSLNLNLDLNLNPNP